MSNERDGYDVDTLLQRMQDVMNTHDRVAAVLYDAALGRTCLVFDVEPDRENTLRRLLSDRRESAPLTPVGFIAARDLDGQWLFATIPLPEYSGDDEAKHYLRSVFTRVKANYLGWFEVGQGGRTEQGRQLRQEETP